MIHSDLSSLVIGDFNDVSDSITIQTTSTSIKSAFIGWRTWGHNRLPYYRRPNINHNVFTESSNSEHNFIHFSPNYVSQNPFMVLFCDYLNGNRLDANMMLSSFD